MNLEAKNPYWNIDKSNPEVFKTKMHQDEVRLNSKNQEWFTLENPLK